MKRQWIDIQKELPPLGEKIKLRSEGVSYKGELYKEEYVGQLYRKFSGELMWKIYESIKYSYHYEIRHQDIEINYWEKIIYEPIKTRFEILDL